MRSSVLRSTLAFLCLACAASCSTAPKAENRASFTLEARAAESWFETNVKGFKDQLKAGGGYIVFPDVGQFGIVFGGSTFGRGAVYSADGEQVGWAALNRASVGLQLGVQAFKMVMVLQNESVFADFKSGKWQGEVGATAVAAQAGAAATTPFDQGVAVYVGDQAGLMAGMSIALAHVRYKNLADVE